MKIMNSSDSRFILTQKMILYTFPILATIGIIGIWITRMGIIKFAKSDMVLLGIYIAIPMFFAPIIYLMRHKNIGAYFSNAYKTEINKVEKNYYKDHWFFIMLILYVLGFSLSIIILDIFDIRPFIYYVVITLLATIILLEILFFDISQKKVVVILLQIMILMLNIIWGVTLKYYYFIGRTDSIVHTWYIYNLMKEGYVTSVFEHYQSFPLWHIMTTSADMILNFDLSIYKNMYFINGLNFAVLILIIYLISLKIFEDKKIALISALFTSINSDIIIFGMYSIPRSVVTFLEALLILLILSTSDFRKDVRTGLLAAFFTIIIIFYHTASMPFILLIFLLIYLLQKLYIIEKKVLTLNYLKLAITATLTSYIYNAINTFKMMTENIDSPVSGVITKSVVYDPLKELFNYLQFSPLLFFILIGLLSVLDSPRFSGFEKIFCITGFLLVWVTFPGPALMLDKLAANFNIERFGEYSLIFMVIVGAIGFIGIYHGTGTKLKIVMVALFMIMTLLSVSNDFNASDNPLVKRVFYTFYLNEEEVLAINHIADINAGYVMSDYVTLRYLQNSPYSKTNILEIDLEDRLLKNTTNDIFLIRNEELEKRPLRFFPSLTGKFQSNPSEKGNYDYYYNNSPLWNNLEKYYKIYDSGGISGYN